MADINVLAKFSKMASKYSETYKVIDIDDYNDGYDNQISFHPNGKCGCIELDDTSLFGIRCNHFMWAKGCCEGIENFWENKTNLNAILIYGNHKGFLKTKMIIFE